MCNKNSKIEIVSKSEDTTENEGFKLAQSLDKGMTIALDGDFGCGKTVFTRGIARGLGINEPITSPSFTIIQEYRDPGCFLYHIDLYRISDEDAALAFGLDEYINNDNAITVIEWAHRIPNLVQHNCIKVLIESRSITERVITIER